MEYVVCSDFLLRCLGFVVVLQVDFGDGIGLWQIDVYVFGWIDFVVFEQIFVCQIVGVYLCGSLLVQSRCIVFGDCFYYNGFGVDCCDFGYVIWLIQVQVVLL